MFLPLQRCLRMRARTLYDLHLRRKFAQGIIKLILAVRFSQILDVGVWKWNWK